MTAPLLTLDRVALRLGSRFSLAVPRLDLGPGVTVVRGPNGSGKSTLLRVLATAVRPDAGHYSVGGAALPTAGFAAADHADHAGLVAVRSMLGFLPQHDSCAPRLTAFDHIDLIAISRQLWPDDPRWRRAAVADGLALVGLTGMAGERCGRLSGGERRRVALAAALIGAPTLLLLDEPDSGLDDRHRQSVADELRRRAPTTTIVVATHDREWAERIADRTVDVDAGVVGQAVAAQRPQ